MSDCSFHQALGAAELGGHAICVLHGKAPNDDEFKQTMAELENIQKGGM